jgi:hypothetical protein
MYRLLFGTEPDSAPAHLGMRSSRSGEAEAFPTKNSAGGTKFQLKLDLLEKQKMSKPRVS